MSQTLASVPVLRNNASPSRLIYCLAGRPVLTVGVCSASNANPNIGYPFLGINPGGCPIWGFPHCFRNFVNGSFPQLGLSIPLFLSLVFFIVVSILVMMSLCRILRSFIGYIVDGDIGAFPLRGLFPLCLLALALDVSMSPRHTDICPSLDLLKLPG